MKKKQLLFILWLSLLCSCQKEAETPKTAFSTNTTFTSMIQQLVSDGLYKNSDGILVFTDMDAFADALDLIDTTGEIIMERDTSADFDEYLSAVASSFNFYSLHQQIESNIRELEETNELFDYNDPDNHFIVSDYMRTFLTPYCEVVIGDVLFVFREGFTIGVMGYYDDATLSAVRTLVYSGAGEDDFAYLCNANPKVYMVSTDGMTMDVDFTADQVALDQLSYKFTNETGSEEYQNVSYLWDFGDGSTSTSVNPTHVYSTTGTKTVTLTSTYEGVTKSLARNITVSKKGCWVDFNYTHNNNGVYFFTANGHVDGGDTPSYYKVYFGDGTDTTIYTTAVKIDFNHKYSSSYYNQTVNVEVILNTHNGNFSSTVRSFIVSHKDCKYNCSAHTGGGSPFPHYHLYDNYYVKSAIRATNFLIFHRLHSKTIFLKKNTNNSFSRVKADCIHTGYSGEIYFDSDNTPDNQCGRDTLVEWGKTVYDRKVVNLERGLRHSFSVDYRSLHSVLSAKKNDEESGNQFGAAVYK